MFVTKLIFAMATISVAAVGTSVPSITVETLTATHDFGNGPTVFSWTTTIDLSSKSGVSIASAECPSPTRAKLGATAKVETITATANFGSGPVPFTWTTTMSESGCVAPTNGSTASGVLNSTNSASFSTTTAGGPPVAQTSSSSQDFASSSRVTRLGIACGMILMLVLLYGSY